MSVRSAFDLLAADSSGDESNLSPREYTDLSLSNGAVISNGNAHRKRKSKKKNKKKKQKSESNGHCESNGNCESNGLGLGLGFTTIEEDRLELDSSRSSSCVSCVELRQRTASANDDGENRESLVSNLSSISVAAVGEWTMRTEEANGGVERLETMASLDWNRVMAQDPSILGDTYTDRMQYSNGDIDAPQF